MRLITVLASLFISIPTCLRVSKKYLDVPSTVTIINLVRQDGSVREFTSLYLRKKLSFAQKYSVTVFFTDIFFPCRGYSDKLENYRYARGSKTKVPPAWGVGINIFLKLHITENSLRILQSLILHKILGC